jgi:hypothetical protein
MPDEVVVNCGRMMIASMHRDELAHRYGLQGFPDLLEISHPLPPMPGERCRSYLAHHKGLWFVWDEGQLDDAPSDGAVNPEFPKQSKPRSPSQEPCSNDKRTATNKDSESRGPGNQSFSGPMRNDS